jgi:electron transfer flavoprotein beta subunit
LNDFNDRDEKKYGLNGSPTQVQRVFPPERNNKREIWNDSGDVLSDKLYQTIKELKFI